MTLSEMEQAISDARAVMNRADTCADKMARLLIGRLRQVHGYNVLKKLKAELSEYNAHTGRWKEDK